MRGWGITLLILGIGAFLLPMAGYQFALLNLVEGYEQIVGGVLAVAGLGLIIASFRESAT